MEKEFVPYQEAMELKELGFDEACICMYNGYKHLKGNIIGSIDGDYIKKEKWDERLPAPTFSQSFRWFREKHDIQYWLNDGGYLGKVFIKITGFKHDKFYFSSSEPMEYEESELACLRRLIEIVKSWK